MLRKNHHLNRQVHLHLIYSKCTFDRYHGNRSCFLQFFPTHLRQPNKIHPFSYPSGSLKASWKPNSPQTKLKLPQTLEPTHALGQRHHRSHGNARNYDLLSISTRICLEHNNCYSFNRLGLLSLFGDLPIHLQQSLPHRPRLRSLRFLPLEVIHLPQLPPLHLDPPKPRLKHRHYLPHPPISKFIHLHQHVNAKHGRHLWNHHVRHDRHRHLQRTHQLDEIVYLCLESTSQ